MAATSSSSASSTARPVAVGPPLTIATNLSGSIPKVGGISAASAVAILPLVPEPA